MNIITLKKFQTRIHRTYSGEKANGIALDALIYLRGSGAKVEIKSSNEDAAWHVSVKNVPQIMGEFSMDNTLYGAVDWIIGEIIEAYAMLKA